MLPLQVICKTPSPLQLLFCEFSDSICLFWFLGCVGSNQQFTTPVPNRTSCCLMTLTCTSARGNSRLERKDSDRSSHSYAEFFFFFFRTLITFWQQFFHPSTNTTLLVWRQCCRDPNDFEDEAQTGGTAQDRTELIWIGCLNEPNWTIQSSCQNVRTNDQLTHVVYQEVLFLTTMEDTTSAVGDSYQCPQHTPIDLLTHRSCFATTVCSIASAIHDTPMTVDTFKEEEIPAWKYFWRCIEEEWHQFSSTSLEGYCKLSQLPDVVELLNQTFRTVVKQDGMFRGHAQPCEGTSQQKGIHFRFCCNKTYTTVTPTDHELSKLEDCTCTYSRILMSW